MTAVFEMGGYGGYVWPAYAVSLLVIGAVALMIWRRARDLKRRLEARQQIAEGPSGGMDTKDPR